MASHEVYDKEYDCAKADVSPEGYKSYHQKGEKTGDCASCDRYVTAMERAEGYR